MEWKNRDRKAPLWLYAVAAVLLLIAIPCGIISFYAPEFFSLSMLYGGAVVGAFVILKAVRWINRREVPRVNPPDPNPDATSESN